MHFKKFKCHNYVYSHSLVVSGTGKENKTGNKTVRDEGSVKQVLNYVD